MDLLYRDYGQPINIATEAKENANKWPRIANGDKEAIRKFSVFITNLVSTKYGNTDMASLDGYEFLKILAGKLPTPYQQKWINEVGRLRDFEHRSPTLLDFDNFVGHQSRNENDPRIAGLGYQRRAVENDGKQHGNNRKNAYATTVQNQQRSADKREVSSKESQAAKGPCLYCKGTSHVIHDCRKFDATSAENKSEHCRKIGLCFGCLRPGHMRKQCRNPEKCKKCSRKHPTVLHNPDWERQPSDQNSGGHPQPEVVTGCVGVKHSNTPLMTVIPVIVKHAAADQGITTYAFVDNGCGAVFADQELVNKLNARTRPTKLLLKTLNLEEDLNTEIVTDALQLGHPDGATFIDLPEIYIKDKIPIRQRDIPTQKDLLNWSHLNSVNLPVLTTNSRYCIPRVTLMVGINVPAATTPLESRIGSLGEPYAIRSPLGWLVYGLAGKDHNTTSVNFCNVSSLTTIQHDNDRLENKLKSYINMEFNESLADGTVHASKEDQRFMKIMEDKVVKRDGHYTAPLPLRDSIQMPNNQAQVHVYAQHLKKKLIKVPPLHQEYNEFMQKLETKGYSEKVPSNEINRDDGKAWYIPHHAVKHPRKKARVVFNCPATFKGTSLNSKLLQGSDMTNRLFGIILRWRKEHVAIMADVEAMFYQVHVPQDERDLLRYLWWADGDLSQNPEIYRMKVHVFGAISSPSCANYALRRCATDNATKYGNDATDAVLHDFYVDDFVKSVESEDEAIKLAKNIKMLLAEGGFNLTKWMSNSRRVIDSIPVEDQAKGVKDLDVHQEDLPTERTLGVKWNAESDEIGVAIKEVNQTATRRNILSVVSGVYDPIGHTAPYVLKAKQLLQVCTKQKLGWDDNLPEEQQQQWNCWLQDLPKLERLKIDRCYKPKSFGKVVDTQLHHFADASQDGYGTVSYLRLTNQEGDVHCSFVTGKARVAPLKPHTIVKMELTAATTSVKQDNLLKREMALEINSTTFWTDSQTVLKYIQNQTTRLPVFVANRLAIIQDGSDENQWKYVPTEMNPADHASRGLSVSELFSKKEWLHGPEFLWKEESKWPSAADHQESKEASDEVNSKMTEIPVHVSTVKNTKEAAPSDNAPNQSVDGFDCLIHHFSDWTKLRRAVAWMIRFKKYLQSKYKPKRLISSTSESKTLTLEEIQDAEEAIIRYVQQKEFKSEQTSQRSFRSLDPELQRGMLRVGGRLRNSIVPQNAKHQVILPKGHHVSLLIIRHAHKRLNHQGRNHVLAEIRKKYWIINARVAVKSIVSKCVVCRKHQSRTLHQKMADLPSSRVKPDEPAFSSTGMDYFGPFEIKQGRSTRKRYGVIFTCMSSRAVHIEVADTMETSSCIDAIRRFIARRGNVKDIYSDNGSNLVGACNELRRSIKELNQSRIDHFATCHDIKWHFNPPAASHHGGVWERQIRTVRKIICAILNEQYLRTCRTEEQLRTLMCEIETTINSRPLTRTSDDPNDLDVITPQDVLLLQPNAAIPPGIFDHKDIYSKRRWRQMQYLADLFWKRWVREYLPELQKRQRWLNPSRNIQVGDLVLIADDQAPRNCWTKGLVQEAHTDKHGLTRSAKIKTKTTVLTRPISKLCLLLENDA